MTRDETVQLLRLRWRTCNQRFDDETADAWHEVLEPIDAARARRALLDHVRSGEKHITLGDIAVRSGTQRPVANTESPDPYPDRDQRINTGGFTATRAVMATFSPVGITLHDHQAHTHDRANGAGIPTCPRCRDHHDTFQHLWRLR